MLKLLAPSAEKTSNLRDLRVSDSEAENTFIAPTLTPIRTKTAVRNIIYDIEYNVSCYFRTDKVIDCINFYQLCSFCSTRRQIS